MMFHVQISFEKGGAEMPHTHEKKALPAHELSPKIKNAKYAVRGAVLKRAREIEKQYQSRNRVNAKYIFHHETPDKSR